MSGPQEYTIKGCRVTGGGSCPEVFWVHIGGALIGQLHTRHGLFGASYMPTGELVLHAWPNGDGALEDYEREKWLTLAVSAIVFRHQGGDEVETAERAELVRLKAKYEGA